MRKWLDLLPVALLAAGISLFIGAQAEAAVPVDEGHFPDASVRAYAQSVDTDKDGELSDEEIKKVTSFDWGLDIMLSYGGKQGATVDFTGMENFTGIKSVSLYDVGVAGYTWNYSDSNLFRYFPYVENLVFERTPYRNDVANTLRDLNREISLTGTADHLENLCIDRLYGGKERWLLRKWDIEAKNLNQLTIFSAYLDKCGFSLEKFSSLKRLIMGAIEFPESGLSLKGLSSLEYLDLCETQVVDLDLSPVSRTLRKLYLGPCLEEEDLNEVYDDGSQKIKTLDISRMEKLEKCWIGHTGLTKVITRDKNGASKTKKLEELCVSCCKIKSIDVTGMPNLRKLCLYSTLLSKLNVTKNKKLELLQLSSPNLKSINLKQNKKLDTLVFGGDIKKLDLSNNTVLRCLRLVDIYPKRTRINSTIKLPQLKKSMKWGFKDFGPGYDLDGGGIYGVRVTTLDLTKITKLTKKTKTMELSLIKDCAAWLKKVEIRKKLKKADRNWIKKKAKAVGAKVVIK